MKRRVVITGMGVVTPLGHSVAEMFDAVVAGRSGVGPTTAFNAVRFPTTFAAQVKDFELSHHIRDAARYGDTGHNCRFALAASEQAMADAGLRSDHGIDPNRMGVYIGCGEGINDFATFISLIARSYQRERREVDAVTFAINGRKEWHPGREFELELHTTGGHLAEYFGFEGPNYVCLTACAASSQAIGEAAWQIRRGDADVMLTGGSHSMIHPFGVTGFNRLTALSTHNANPQKASRPFDLTRDGFVLGEGSGMLVLEELEHATKRGATIHAELTGYGTTADAYRATDSHPEGRGAIACIQMALKDSGLPLDAIGYVNAHGTSTQVNDKVETLAIKKVFGERAYRIPVSSSKSMLGHLIAAAGAVELIISIQAMRRGVLPPTINYETPDPDCDLDYLPNEAREQRARHALSNSFGFGGQNISLIASLFDR